jgi:IS30 family transposase
VIFTTPVEVTGQQSNQVKGRLDRLHRSLIPCNQGVCAPEPLLGTPTTAPPRRRRQRRLSVEQVRNLVHAYQTGVAVNRLAADFGVHRSTVLDHVHRAGTRRRYPALDGHQVEEAAHLRRLGKSFRDIGNHLGVHASTVRQYLRRAGFTL